MRWFVIWLAILFIDILELGGVSDVSFKNVMMSLVNVGKLYHDNLFLEVKEKLIN